MKPLNIPIETPIEIHEAIHADTVLAVSVSGGKDSEALLVAVMAWYRANALTNRIFAIHADLGRAEWKDTPEYVERICEREGIELVVVRATDKEGNTFDLVDRIERRAEQVRERNIAPFPSAMQRYCTSDLKSKPINRYLRQFENVVSIEGVRWQESKARSEKPRVKVRSEIATRGRKALTWNAICDYTEDDVWATRGMDQARLNEARTHYATWGVVPSWWAFHPAYAMGNSRLSCAICILGSKSDMMNGIKHNPELADTYERIERESGFKFKQGFGITDAKALLDTPILSPKRFQLSLF